MPSADPPACADPIPASNQSQNGKRSLFTPEKARAAALKRYENERVRLLELEQGMAAVCQDTAQKPDDYMLRRLTRVRGQLDRLDVMMQTETDPQKLDRLASAQAKLAEQERQLAGRPLPGSLRPSNRPTAGGMIEQPQTSAPGPSSTPPVQSEAQE